MKQIPSHIKVLYHAVSLFYELSGPIKSEKVVSLKNKDGELATKKDGLKVTNANWASVYEGLISEIKLRHYSPKTLKSYRLCIRDLQNYTRSKDPQLLSTAVVKDFLTFLAVNRNVSASSRNMAFDALLFLFRMSSKRILEKSKM